MFRRRFLAELGSVGGAIAIAGCSGPSNGASGTTTPSLDEIKENASAVKHESLYRDNSQYKGEYVVFEDVYIADVVTSDDGLHEYIIGVPQDGLFDDDYLWGTWTGDPYRENDQITLWGKVTGLHEYDTLGGNKTVPELELVDIELLDSA
ncbi:hypothetical protein C499_08967 [Halogeometricum borinquense DSM 11551]|uniref:Uncharacterized protein n=2 Tax=Halogeometricum borinquense TaxID=60847 RepID=E4NNG7_HALBP|nr:hypothetical protein [Halogeometricum borinquense]ADQ66321.1 hypothetical protein Hbor_07230 [Halogeometricum borinquense DSM 11551]ELY27689.1 hypothetical protein C499_08967 [Halogeometricum borinquense DSM 11551]RYJ14667.1 hypothetical protein ELS19_12370 [Halogeometricum borinquense]